MVCWISSTVSAVSVASLPISVATTANPLPDSPARAASMEAFSDSRLICSAMLDIDVASVLICSTVLPRSMAADSLSENSLERASAALLASIELVRISFARSCMSSACLRPLFA